MKKNITKKIIILSSFALLLTAVWNTHNNSSTKKEVAKEDFIEAKKVTSKDSKDFTTKKSSQRSIAAINPKKSKDQRKRIGGLVNQPIINTINAPKKTWKTKYKENFFRMGHNAQIKNFEIKHKKSATLVKRNIAKNVEHILVSYNLPNGDAYSFEAYIDSQTGQLVQAWNKTRPEFKKGLNLSGQGKVYKPSI